MFWNLALWTRNALEKNMSKIFLWVLYYKFFPDHFGAFFGGMRVGQNVRLGYPRRASHSKCTKLVRKKNYITKPTKIFWTCFSAERFEFRGPSSRTFHVCRFWKSERSGKIFYNTKPTKIFWMCFFFRVFWVPSAEFQNLPHYACLGKVGSESQNAPKKKFIIQNPQKYFGRVFLERFEFWVSSSRTCRVRLV